MNMRAARAETENQQLREEMADMVDEIERLRAMIEKLLQDRRDETARRQMIEALTGREGGKE
jgi:hypothetical protein